MIFLANIGNTNLTYGLYNTNFIASERYPMTDLAEQHSIYNLCLSLIKKLHISMDKIDGVVLSSVVPEKTQLFMDAFRNIFSMEPMLITAETVWGIDRSEYSGILGSDRLLCCKAALKNYHPPLIVIDCGTATTINVIDKLGAFIGGAILPGVMTGIQALTAGTSLLKPIAITDPKNVIGKNTAECMLSGAVYGTAAQLEGLVIRIQRELESNAPVILTGGNAEAVISYCSIPLQLESDLLLQGLAMLYEEGTQKSE